MKKSITYEKFHRVYSRSKSVKLQPSSSQYAVCYYQAPNTGEWFEYYHSKEKGFCYRETADDKALMFLDTYHSGKRWFHRL